MIVCTPPRIKPYEQSPKIFMGGGIGECPDWQREFIVEMNKIYNQTLVDYQLINPRWNYAWTGFQQIQWEFNMLKNSDAIIMWFARGGQNRIVFYELGLWVNNSKIPAFIGCDPEFDRKEDVAIQTHLSRPELPIYTNLKDIAWAIRRHFDSN